MKLIQKTILLTGASTGIGKELARQLATRQNRLFLLARREDLLRELVETLDYPQLDHRYFVCDVADNQQVEKLCSDLLRQKIAFDVLIFNAGVGETFLVNHIDEQNFRYLYEVNMMNIITFLKNLLPAMLEQGSGTIATISSFAGCRGMPRSASYSSSKAALSIFTESLRVDLWNSGINVSLILPGFVKTPMTDKNDFPMPFMISAEKAAKCIIKGLEKEKTTIPFPLRMWLTIKLAKLLPDKFYANLMHGRK
ncbi:MAG TPA: SDR family NAD(P)-dependent oxidoreductase [bacterium]|nr:SDR family NAD(P)-dependent oxidoreductase [bacterium]